MNKVGKKQVPEMFHFVLGMRKWTMCSNFIIQSTVYCHC
jgi:hypothetical protein